MGFGDELKTTELRDDLNSLDRHILDPCAVNGDDVPRVETSSLTIRRWPTPKGQRPLHIPSRERQIERVSVKFAAQSDQDQRREPHQRG